MQSKGKVSVSGYDTGAPQSGTHHRVPNRDGEDRLLQWIERRAAADDSLPTHRQILVPATSIPGIEEAVRALEDLGFERRRIETVLGFIQLAPEDRSELTVAKVFVLARRLLERGVG